MKYYAIIDRARGYIAMSKDADGLIVSTNWDELEHILDYGEFNLTHEYYEIVELASIKLKPHSSERI